MAGCIRVVEWLGLVALCASCGRSEPGSDLEPTTPQCVSGQQVACACFDGTTGAQRCQADGSFAACACLSGDSGTGGSASGAMGGSGVFGGTSATGGTFATGGTGGTVGTGGSNGGAGGSGAQSGAGGSTGGDSGGDAGTFSGRRLALPCTAALPTGYCLVSDSGDYIGGGKTTEAAGEDSVEQGSYYNGGQIDLRLVNASNGDDWSVDFVAPEGEPLVPGLYEGATRYPFQLETVPGLSIYGNGRGCNRLTGKFAIEELKVDPELGLVRFSATFEQHCEGGTSALRGVINLQASGTPDPTPTPDQTIALDGKIFRVVHDSGANLAYGLDATNRRLAKIDLASGDVTYADVVQVPNAACLDPERERLFVVNKGSSLITEYDTRDLSTVRDIGWTGTDSSPTETHFEIHCAPERLYVVDGGSEPGLLTVEELDEDEPVVLDHTEEIAGVGGMVLNAAHTDLYYWYQDGWTGGSLSTGVHRLLAADLSEVDVTGDVADYHRDPLDAPILLDEERGLVFSKNKIFDASNLTKVVYSLPSAFDAFDGAAENAYALDPRRGFMATKNYVYDLERYDIDTATLVTNADQLFFDKSGGLWFLSISKGVLVKQLIERK